MKKEIDYLEIENYLLGELKGDSLHKFEEKLQNDAHFAKEVALYKEINSSLSSRFSNYDEENKLRNTLEDLGNFHIKNNSKLKLVEQAAKPKTKVFSIKKYTKYLVAASVILFASILWMNSDKKAPNYYDYNQFEQIDLVVRGDNNSHLIEAQNAFNAKDFLKASKEFKILLKEDKTKVELQLYLGICLIEQNKFQLADEILSGLSKGNSIYKNEATWYLALSKLKQKDYKTCNDLLKTIPKDTEKYAQAQNLLDKL